MNITELKYTKYKFNLKPPLKISNQTLFKKDVILLKLISNENKVFYGEVAPLFGFSLETIEQCEEQLHDLEKLLNFIRTEDIDSIQKRYSAHPSLLFGIEQLLFRGEIINSLQSFESKKIRINALIGMENEEEILKKVGMLIETGFDTIKLKIGRPDFRDDISILYKIYEIFGSKIKLRLDNNGSWNIDEAKRNIEKLSKFNIEYLEQPMSNVDDLFMLSEFSEIPIALDESISNYKVAEQILERGQFKFLVLKPSIRLGISKCIKLIELSNTKDVNIIISSAFETAVGRSALLFLAALTHHDYAHGLNTFLPGSELISTRVNYKLPIILAGKSNFDIYSVNKF